MNLLYNDNLLHENELMLPISNRAFQFNDGFFETMMVVNGKIRFWQDHLDRIFAAAKALKIDLPETIEEATFEEKLLKLAAANNALKLGRLKLKIWRSGAGIYTPETNEADWIATVTPAEAAPSHLNKVGICTQVRTHYSALSSFKGPNSLLYVMASNEKKAQNLDDLILLDRQGRVAELTSSNIFWYKQDTLYTPSLETGCINGIMRRNILRWVLQEKIKIKEVFFDVDAILQADAVFAANVTGIKEIKNLIGFDLNSDATFTTFLLNNFNEA